MKTILLFQFFRLSDFHCATALEIIDKHLNAGDKVYVVKCGTVLDNCYTNIDKNPISCMMCQSNSLSSRKLLDSSPEEILDLKQHPKVNSIQWQEFDTVEELKSYRYKDVDIGLGVASSLITTLRDHNFDVKENRTALNRLMRSAHNVYWNGRELFDKYNPDITYIWNGRFAVVRPILRLAQQRNMKVFCYERGSTLEKYGLFEDTLAQDLEYIANEIEATWKKEEDKERARELAKQWFEERRKGVVQNWKPYTKDQTPMSLPEGFESSKHNIGIYISSEDEFAAIDKRYDNHLFQNQQHALEEIGKHFASNDDIHLYLRIHPNLKDLDNTQTRQLKTLPKSHFNIIPADSPIDSYHLMDSCDTILTFGSTMGMEAAYWKIPSILGAKALYQSLGSVYTPKSKEELYDLLEDKNLKPKDREGAYKFGFWYASYGHEFENFQPVDIFRGKYKGTFINAGFKYSILKVILSIWLFLKIRINKIWD